MLQSVSPRVGADIVVLACQQARQLASYIGNKAEQQFVPEWFPDMKSSSSPSISQTKTDSGSEPNTGHVSVCSTLIIKREN